MNDATDLLVAARFTCRESGLWLDAADAVGAVPTDAGVFVGWVDVTWPGAGSPVLELHDVVHLAGPLTDNLGGALDEARRRHTAVLRACRHCGERYTPGRMHSVDVCHGCAERHLGVVH